MTLLPTYSVILRFDVRILYFLINTRQQLSDETKDFFFFLSFNKDDDSFSVYLKSLYSFVKLQY